MSDIPFRSKHVDLLSFSSVTVIPLPLGGDTPRDGPLLRIVNCHNDQTCDACRRPDDWAHYRPAVSNFPD
jgi:hypothetical protein